MISPLGQRQIFQTANIEAVRQAHEVSEQIQRENVRKLVADEQLLEDEASVRVVANSEGIRAGERQERQEQQPSQGEASSGETNPEEEESSAESADSHLDFLA